MSLFDKATLYFLVAVAIYISKQKPDSVVPTGSLDEFIGLAYLITSVVMFALCCAKIIEKVCNAYEDRRWKGEPK